MAQILQFPRQRRRHRRARICQPVALVHDNATVATATAVNLSHGGLQVLCDRYTVDSLRRSDEPLGGPATPRIDAHFRLPLSFGLVKIDCECRLVYVSEVSEHACLMGLEFVAVRGNGGACLEEFLREAERLAGP